MFKNLVYAARSYRRFKETTPVPFDLLAEMVDAARMAPSSANFQITRFAISTKRTVNAEIFQHLGWAGLLKDWKGPAEGERPAAYIVVGCDNTYPKNHQIDTGIVAQTIQLGLCDAGLACCMLGNINAKAIHQIVQFPEDVSVTLVIAIGAPNEKIITETLEPGQPTAYWRDDNGGHHVPKRTLDAVLIRSFRD